VGIIGFNAPEWVIAFHGSVYARCIPVGVYPTNSTAACEYIAEHSETRVVIAENWMHAKKYISLLEQGKIRNIVLYSEEVGEKDYGGRVVHWRTFIESGKEVPLQHV
jgi:long-subunit acyl-CoA synthetase (AMP-forming)